MVNAAIATHSLPQQKTNHTVSKAVVRWPQKTQHAESALNQYTLLFRERIKSRFSVIVTHAAWANASEGQIVLRDVKNDVVQRDAARNCRSQNLSGTISMVIEVVKRQRMRMVVDVFQRLLKLSIGHDRKNRTKNLFLHHAHGIVNIQQSDGGKNTVF